MTTETTTSTLAKTSLRQKLAHFQDDNEGFYYESNLVKDSDGYHVKVLADFTLEPQIEATQTRIYLIAPFKHQPTEDPELIATSEAMSEMIEAVNEAITDSIDNAEALNEDEWSVTDSRNYSNSQEEPRVIKDRLVKYGEDNQ